MQSSNLWLDVMLAVSASPALLVFDCRAALVSRLGMRLVSEWRRQVGVGKSPGCNCQRCDSIYCCWLRARQWYFIICVNFGIGCLYVSLWLIWRLVCLINAVYHTRECLYVAIYHVTLYLLSMFLIVCLYFTVYSVLKFTRCLANLM